MKCFNFYLLAMLTLCPTTLFAQAKTSEIDISNATPSVIEVESQVQKGLPDLLEKIQQAQRQLKKNQWKDATTTINQAKSDLTNILDSVNKFSNYQEVALGLENIALNLREASFALERRRKADANREIGEAYKTTKALSESPVLKLSAAKVSIGAANREILHRNYSNAGNLLGRAIDDLSALQDNPNVNQQEINSLKNDIVIAHQQVILGKMQKKTYLNQLYDRASAASTNALYQYYDMWSRTVLPWDQY